MADIQVDLENKNGEELFAQGVRAYIMEDYNAAVAALSKTSELYAAEHGDDQHESLGEVYLYYGKALLGLSREESEALGDAVPKNVDEGEESEGEDEEEGEPETAENGDAEKKVEAEKENEPEKETVEEEKAEEPSSSTEKTEETDEPTDLQLAWEVLELAKKIFQKAEDKKNIAETVIVLGEVSLESGNYEQAINDLKEGLEIQKSIYSKDNRFVAETLYKLGIGYSTNSEIDEAVKCFNESLEYLNNRIALLEKKEKKEQSDEEEIKAIKDLVPEIEEKIVDMKSLKDETIKQIVSSVLDPKPSTNGEAKSSSETKANNISHLVKRKRKLDDIVQEKTEAVELPAKKPSP